MESVVKSPVEPQLKAAPILNNVQQMPSKVVPVLLREEGKGSNLRLAKLRQQQTSFLNRLNQTTSALPEPLLSQNRTSIQEHVASPLVKDQ